MIEYISVMAIPMMIAIILVVAIIEKKEILPLFIEGALNGIKVVFKIFPHILAIMVAVALFRETNAMEIFFKPLNGLLTKINVPKEIVTLSLLRPISGGAASSIVMDIFSEYGPDSIQGKIASILMGGTETTLYVTTILFGAAHINKTRGTLIAAILADITAMVLSIYIVVNGYL